MYPSKVCLSLDSPFRRAWVKMSRYMSPLLIQPCYFTRSLDSNRKNLFWTFTKNITQRIAWNAGMHLFWGSEGDGKTLKHGDTKNLSFGKHEKGTWNCNNCLKILVSGCNWDVNMKKILSVIYTSHFWRCGSDTLANKTKENKARMKQSLKYWTDTNIDTKMS